ncbi:MAG: LPS export ABC transporter periplasmic protein LptC [Bacteroidetes bacterium]|nr:LPS export ABC transporter periplasmic protein LptC [Bacteroidota bacterium]MBS1739205.1 LPS export ABC transporter periplasmic protein LptC [Bacteroidota bacterium]MBS1775654.1 LPS export ABC transporter periplasmic protein LptC [Bacteroidota bacterium]
MTKCWLYLLLLTGILFSCKNKTSEINELLAKSVFAEDKADEVVIIFSEDGKVKGRLFATQFIINEQAKPPFMDARKGLRIESFDDSTHLQSTLTAKYARYYPQKGNILIRDSIVVVNKKGERLQTEELVWNDKLKKFYTGKPVTIKTITQTMYGDGLEANQDFTRYQITNIKGIIQVNKTEIPGN